MERELLPVEVYQALKVLSPLRFDKGDAKEGEPRLPVPEEDFRAVLPNLFPPAKALVELIMATGLRVGEACQMRMEDLNRSKSQWVYTLRAHRTVAAVGARKVYLGPEVRRILLPFLRLDAGYLFQPRDAVAARHARDRARPGTLVQPILVDRSKVNPLRSSGKCYCGELRKSVYLACRRAGVPEWCLCRRLENGHDSPCCWWFYPTDGRGDYLCCCGLLRLPAISLCGDPVVQGKEKGDSKAGQAERILVTRGRCHPGCWLSHHR